MPILLEACSGGGVLRARELLKPKCTQAGCDGEHTPGVHKLLGEESAEVNLVAEGEY